MKDLLAGLLALIESKSIPAAYKFLVGAAVLAVLLRVAGFPVVSYVETGVREAFAKAPYIAGMCVGVLIGSLIPHALKGYISALVKLSVTAFGLASLSSEERRFTGRIISFIGLGILVLLSVVVVRILAAAIVDL